MLYHFHVTKNAKQIIEEEGGKTSRTADAMWVIGETLQECCDLALADERMRQATMLYAQQAAQMTADKYKNIFSFHRKNNYKGVLPKKMHGGTAEMIAETRERLHPADAEEPTEGHSAMMCFELWQDMIVSQAAPSERRFANDFLALYGKNAENSALFYMFCGFLGGMDFAQVTNNLMIEKGQGCEK